MKYTFLSKWTVLVLTLLTVLLIWVGVSRAFIATPHDPLVGTLLIMLGAFVYALAWIVAFIDSVQEKVYAWSVVLLLLLPFAVGPLFYSLIGPKNTK
jgi:hypothetical protein